VTMPHAMRPGSTFRGYPESLHSEPGQWGGRCVVVDGAVRFELLLDNEQYTHAMDLHMEGVAGDIVGAFVRYRRPRS